MYTTEFLDIPSLASAGGTVQLPGSKSISNRVLLLAALSAGTTRIHDLLESDDTRVMLQGLQQLGCGVQSFGNGALHVEGLGGQLKSRAAKLFLGNAGTAMRPLTAALALLATPQGGAFELSGIARMHERPIGDLVDALRQLGCPVQYLGQEGFPPLRLGDEQSHTLMLDAPIRVRGDVSSQFLTALLLALPLVATDQDVVIEVVGELISRPYIDITLNLLRKFGVQVHEDQASRFVIPAGSRYVSPGDIAVEGDASSASYFIALGALAPASPGELGATIEEGADFIRITPPATPQDWRAASIHTYDDHRVAMCFSLAAFNPAHLPVRIEDPKCVGKTFPTYFRTLFKVCQTPPSRIPVICIDGPSASGKGTLASEVAERLGYHVLDSGSLYRLVALAAQRQGISTLSVDLKDPAHAEVVGTVAASMHVRFFKHSVHLDGDVVTDQLREEAIGAASSRVSVVPQVRQALLDVQLAFLGLPGLVADGRDMGTVIFPQAPLKVFLTASAQQRADRRYKQLISKGKPANIDDLLVDLMKRDQRDMSRTHAPLKPAEDALLLDNSNLTIEQSVEQVLRWWQDKSAFPNT